MVPKASVPSKLVKLPLPTAASAVEDHGDWIEWHLITTATDFIAWSDYARGIRQSESENEVSAETGVANNPMEALIDDIAAELQERQMAAGEAYPFTVTGMGLAKGSTSHLAYEFMLALSLFGIDRAGTSTFPERLFEIMCSQALGAYLGSPNLGVRSEVFGSPRPVLPKSFKTAVNTLCSLLGEGIECKVEPGEKMQDAALDLVAWRRFPDGRASQLLVFGQCAAGDDWSSKLSQLRADKWCQLWLRDMPQVAPVPAFFVPRRIQPERLRRAGVLGGLLFDRCRIAWLARLDPDLLGSVSEWLASVAAFGVPIAS